MDFSTLSTLIVRISKNPFVLLSFTQLLNPENQKWLNPISTFQNSTSIRSPKLKLYHSVHHFNKRDLITKFQISYFIPSSYAKISTNYLNFQRMSAALVHPNLNCTKIYTIQYSSYIQHTFPKSPLYTNPTSQNLIKFQAYTSIHSPNAKKDSKSKAGGAEMDEINFRIFGAELSLSVQISACLHVKVDKRNEL